MLDFFVFFSNLLQKKKKNKYIILTHMIFFKIIAYIICFFTPPFGWVILYLMMRDNQDRKEFKESIRKMESDSHEQLEEFEFENIEEVDD